MKIGKSAGWIIDLGGASRFALLGVVFGVIGDVERINKCHLIK